MPDPDPSAAPAIRLTGLRKTYAASGKVPAAIHVSPEASVGGPLARLRDGDLIRLDARTGRIDCLAPDFEDRPAVAHDPAPSSEGTLPRK